MNASLEIGAVHLRISNLERSLTFYRQIGFELVTRTMNRAELRPASRENEGGELILMEDRTAAPAQKDAAGLFHAAMLLPTRAALGEWLRRSADEGVQFQGFSDHGVSEAIYLADPDGIGLEFYADKPRQEWPLLNGELQMVTEPLALPALLAAAVGSSASNLLGSRWGHLHLRVRDVDKSANYYASKLGLTLTQRFGDRARFLATDNYHHHLGLNSWGGIRTGRPPDALGFVSATIASRTITTPEAIADPDGIALELYPLRGLS